MLSLYIHLMVVNDNNEHAPVRLNLGSNQGGQCVVSLGLVGWLWFPSMVLQGVRNTVDMSLHCSCIHPLAR
jgi:hypothetical protein